MTQNILVPLWLLILILAFAATSFASNFLFPSVRWFFRRRMERWVARLNERLERPIDIFKLAERQDRIARLSYDPKVLEAVTERAAEAGIPPSVAFEEARRYAREIVPGFSTTLYFGVAIRAAKWLTRKLYRVRFARIEGALRPIDPKATVVFVMNHRSNMDYVLVTWLVANRASISYAVGEWARIWPFSYFIRAMGAYFIRRGSRNTLYRRVLARYVQMTTVEGISQAIFPEGGLSLDGRVGPAKLGLLSYILAGFDPQGRDVVFVPVGLAYDRVPEDRILTAAAQGGERRFRVSPIGAAGFAVTALTRLVFGSFKGFGTAAAAFGAPISLREFLAEVPQAPAEVLGERLMAAIARVVPVVPVPLVAAALDGGGGRPAIVARAADLAQRLAELGAELRLAPHGIAATVDEALAAMVARGLILPDLTPVPARRAILEFYAASVQQRLELSSDHECVTVDLPKAAP
ncbi:glycerol-3-phosphate acyltransferase [bacterium]|nr:glycerol-3-phosphate acyltransferase [bacterium]